MKQNTSQQSSIDFQQWRHLHLNVELDLSIY